MRIVTTALDSSTEFYGVALACACRRYESEIIFEVSWKLLHQTCLPHAGYLFCNGPTFNATVGERVRFYLMTLGTEADLHNPNLITSQWTALVRRLRLHVGST